MTIKNTIAPLAKAGDRTALAAFLNPAPPTLEERVTAAETLINLILDEGQL